MSGASIITRSSLVTSNESGAGANFSQPNRLQAKGNFYYVLSVFTFDVSSTRSSVCYSLNVNKEILELYTILHRARGADITLKCITVHMSARQPGELTSH